MAQETSDNSKVWLITGCSTGLGRALAEAVLAHGDKLIATARRAEQVQDIVAKNPDAARAVKLDVTKPDEVRDAVKAAVDAFGRIDVLVNNAGYGLLGAIEEVEESAIREQFETNVFGALALMRAVLPVMRKQRSGHILNISSVGGFVGNSGAGIYNATKFALEGMSEALALEGAPLGIKMTIVEPGAFRTDWAGRSLNNSAREIEDYVTTSGQIRERISNFSGQQQGDPNRAAAAMIKCVESTEPPLRLVLGADALERIRGKLSAMAKELEMWERTTIETTFESSEK